MVQPEDTPPLGDVPGDCRETAPPFLPAASASLSGEHVEEDEKESDEIKMNVGGGVRWERGGTEIRRQGLHLHSSAEGGRNDGETNSRQKSN